DIEGRRSVYSSEVSYLEDAVNEAFHGTPEAPRRAGGIAWRRHANDVAQLEPTDDLIRRLDLLPEDYVRQRQVREQLALATSPQRATIRSGKLGKAPRRLRGRSRISSGRCIRSRTGRRTGRCHRWRGWRCRLSAAASTTPRSL